MAPRKGYLLGRNAARQIVRAVRKTEALLKPGLGRDRAVAAAQAGHAQHTNYVSLTSLTKSGIYYPGLWQRYNPADGTLTAKVKVWVKELNDLDLSLDVYYLAREEGDATAGGETRRVYVVDEGGGGVCWVRVLCTVDQPGGYPGQVQSYNNTTRTFSDQGGLIATSNDSVSSGANVTVTVSSTADFGVGQRVFAIDGFCAAEVVRVKDVSAGGSSITADFASDLVADGIASITITDAGSGYSSSPPSITFSGGSGSGASATAVLDGTGDFVASVTIDTPGHGYTSLPTVTFSPPGSGTTATGTAVSSGPVHFYSQPIWVQFVAGAYAPVQNDVDQPVYFWATSEGAYLDDVPVKLSLGGFTLTITCADGSSFSFYSGNGVSYVPAP